MIPLRKPFVAQNINAGVSIVPFGVLIVVTLAFVDLQLYLILKSKFDWLFGVLGLIFLTIILIFSVKIYKKWRERKQ